MVPEQEQEAGFHPLTTVAVTGQAFFFDGYWAVLVAGGRVCAVICCSIFLFAGLIRKEVIFLSLRETKIGDTRCFLRPHGKARVRSRVAWTQSELFTISAPLITPNVLL